MAQQEASSAAPPFESTTEFLQVFGPFEETPYTNITPLTDRRVGFSVIRPYPGDLLFKPALTKEGKPDSVALLHVVYVHPDDSQRPVNPNKVPITIDASVHSRFLGKGHFDYRFDDPDAPTRESVEASKKTFRPLPLDSLDDYYLDHTTRLFYDDRGNTYTGIQLLDAFFGKHCKTAHRWKGFPIRQRIHWRRALTGTFGLAIELLTWCLRAMFGRTLKKEAALAGFLTGYPTDALILLSDEAIDFLGYKASKRAVITFATCVTIFAIFYAVFSKAESAFLNRLFSNPLFAASIVVFLLWIVDVQLPKLLFSVLNRCIRLRATFWFKPVKI